MIADRDEPGLKHAQDVAASLKRAGVVVKLFQAAVGKDARDHLATDLLNDSPPAEEVLSPDETARRLEVARFMGPPFKTAQLQFYSLMTGPLATAAMVSQNADWGLALARRDVGGFEAVLATAPLLEDKIHKAMAAAARSVLGA